MNHTPGYILAQYFISAGALITPGESGSWPVYVGKMPDGRHAPHNAVAIMDTTSVKDGRLMITGENIFHPGIQILVRATDFNEGYAMAVSLAALLEPLANEDVTVESDEYRIAAITQTTGVIPLGQEEGSKRREMFSTNFLATIKERG